MSDFIKKIFDAITMIEEQGAVPSTVEVTREQYEALLAQFYAEGMVVHPTGNTERNSIFGIQIVVKD